MGSGKKFSRGSKCETARVDSSREINSEAQADTSDWVSDLDQWATKGEANTSVSDANIVANRDTTDAKTNTGDDVDEA
jgi:hypothetical protein